MGPVIEIELPYPPTVNHYYKYVRGRVFITTRGRKYREAVCYLIRANRLREIFYPIEMEIDWYLPDRRKRDIDNILKSLLDAMERGRLYENDSQIVKLTIEKHSIVKGGRVIVRIKEIKHRTYRLEKGE